MLIENNKKLFKIVILEPKLVNDLPERMEDMQNCFFESNDDTTAFLFDTGDDLLNSVKDYMEKNNMDITIEDISEKVLLGLTKDEKFDEVFISALTAFGNPLERLNHWKKANLDVNDILDKINLYGIESLNEIDKQILEGK